MERVIITGANGFIGRNFIKHLVANKVEVYAVSLSHDTSTLKSFESIHFIECSLNKMEELVNKISDRGFDAFYHFAWAGTTGKDRANYAVQSKNAIYTCDAAMVSKKLGCKKFITTGTITEKVAEGILSNFYTSENLIYGLSKLYTHNLLHVLCHKEKIHYIWAKLSNIFGGDNSNGNLISYTLKEFNENRTPDYGPCQQPYNFTYIDDVIEALFLLGNCYEIGSNYFISNGECMLLKDYLLTLASIYGKKVNLGVRKDDGIQYKNSWFDNSSILEIGYKPKYTFIQGIKKIRGGQ